MKIYIIIKIAIEFKNNKEKQVNKLSTFRKLV